MRLSSGIWKRTAVLLAVAAVGITAGIALGNLYSGTRAVMEARAEADQLQQHLETNIRGIATGQRFPEVPLWDAQGRFGYHLDQLLPDGGIVYYLAAECGSCYAALANLAQAKKILGVNALPIVVVVEGDPAMVVEYVADNGYELDIYQDAEKRFSEIHGVVAFPAFFRIDGSGLVREFGTHVKRLDDVKVVISRTQ